MEILFVFQFLVSMLMSWCENHIFDLSYLFFLIQLIFIKYYLFHVIYFTQLLLILQIKLYFYFYLIHVPNFQKGERSFNLISFNKNILKRLLIFLIIRRKLSG